MKRSSIETTVTDERTTANRVWAEIDLERVANNFRLFKTSIPSDMSVLVVVKADAYGHGAVPVARRVVMEGADFLGVGDSREAHELRAAGIRVPILILGAIIEEEIESVIAHDISPCIHSIEKIRLLEREAMRQDKRAKVHLMVDTGMARLGVGLETAEELIRRTHAASHLELEGICTHLSSVYGQSPEDRRYTEQQFHRFRRMLSRLHGMLPKDRLLIHATNSGAIYRDCELFNMVRPGSIIYGLGADTRSQRAMGVAPALSLKSQVIFYKDVPEETPVSYDRTFVTERPTRIATIPVGYNDGFRYGLSNRARVLIHGTYAPVIGKVTMDYTMIDVTDVPGVELGDVVTLIGRDGDHEIEVDDLASLLSTTPLEITCGLGRRIRRVYSSEVRMPFPATTVPVPPNAAIA